MLASESPPYSEARVGPSGATSSNTGNRGPEREGSLPMPLEAALPLPRASPCQSSWACGNSALLDRAACC